jgi:uncharacterized protein with HEPN domain
LQVLGEAAKRVSDPTRALSPNVPWRSITGFRDVLIHDYFGVDLDVVCDVVFVKVPALQVELRVLLRALDGAS